MSTTTDRIPLAVAETIGIRLMQTWGLREPEAMIVGSVRRKRADVGDLELIAPMPPEGETDHLYKVLRDTLAPVDPEPEPTTLFGAKPAPRNYIGRVLKGLKPGFKSMDAEVQLRTTQKFEGVEITGDLPMVPLKIQLSRYTAGPVSNRGWYEIRTTGSADFGKAFLTLWKWARGIPQEREGSIDNYLVDEQGQKRHTPTEMHAFQLVGVIWVEPHLRTGWDALLAPPQSPLYQKQRPERRAVAMRYLGIKDEKELADRWNMDKVAIAGGGR